MNEFDNLIIKSVKKTIRKDFGDVGNMVFLEINLKEFAWEVCLKNTQSLYFGFYFFTSMHKLTQISENKSGFPATYLQKFR